MKQTTRSISLLPRTEIAERLDTLLEALRMSRAGFCVLSLEFALNQVESGKMAVINGRLQPVTT